MRFEELRYHQTPLGELTLRVRDSASVAGTRVYEVKLNGSFLMSSLVNESEKALADLAFQKLGSRAADVLIGGLGLGYTAAAALEHVTARRVRVIEYLQPIIDWHRSRLVPAAERLMTDPRCELVRGDFFEHIENRRGTAEDLYDAILLDIDHSPDSLLSPAHKWFYGSEGFRRLSLRLRPRGVFALWSAGPPPRPLIQQFHGVFRSVSEHRVSFYNPLLHEQDENTVVVAQL